MTLRDKKIKRENISGFFEGDKSDTEIISEITKYINLELKDYEALVEAVGYWLDERTGPANENLEERFKPFLPPPKLSDRLDELADKASQYTSDNLLVDGNELREIASELKEQGL